MNDLSGKYLNQSLMSSPQRVYKTNGFFSMDRLDSGKTFRILSYDIGMKNMVIDPENPLVSGKQFVMVGWGLRHDARKCEFPT